MINVVLPFVLDKSVLTDVKHFVLTSDKKYWTYNTTCSTKNRFYCNISDTNISLKNKVNLLRKNIFFNLNIHYFLDEHVYGNFIGINKDGGNVHQHIDQTYNDMHHIRINCLIQKPLSGGMPILNGVEYCINEGQCWFNNASLWSHGSTIVKGKKDRIVLSLGAYVKPLDFERVNSKILRNF